MKRIALTILGLSLALAGLVVAGTVQAHPPYHPHGEYVLVPDGDGDYEYVRAVIVESDDDDDEVVITEDEGRYVFVSGDDGEYRYVRTVVVAPGENVALVRLRLQLEGDLNHLRNSVDRLQEAAAFRDSEVTPGTQQRLLYLEADVERLYDRLHQAEQFPEAAQAESLARLAESIADLENEIYLIMRSM